MKREAYQDLLKWKNNSKRQPLIIQGARQVGKTYLMKDFGLNEFPKTAYFNFEQQPLLCKIFETELTPQKILQGLSLLSNDIIDPKNTLIIFDEIQACKNAITALKYFEEAEERYFILAAGSLLGVAIHEGVSFPVGKVGFLQLHPFNFIEFMEATGKQQWINLLQENDIKWIQTFSSPLETLLKEYLIVGGMPAVVMEFVENGQYQNCRIKQQEILQSYENDFSKHAPLNQLPRIRQVWQSLVSQLTKENSKFIYSAIRNGARAKDFELAIHWLKDAGLIQKVTRVKKPGFPLDAYAAWEDFKLFLHDVGLLGALAQLPTSTVLDDNKLFTEFKGMMTEQYVLQQLISRGHRGYYWHPENATSEVDFLIMHEQAIIPVEVKSGQSIKSKSLSVYHTKHPSQQAIRLSLLPYKKQEWITNIPLYVFTSWLTKMD